MTGSDSQSGPAFYPEKNPEGCFPLEIYIMGKAYRRVCNSGLYVRFLPFYFFYVYAYRCISITCLAVSGAEKTSRHDVAARYAFFLKKSLKNSYICSLFQCVLI